MAVSREDTKIVFFGGAYNPLVLEGVVGLKKSGYDIIACDHDPRETVIFDKAGIPVVRDRYEALESADVVLTNAFGPEKTEDLYLGDGGLLEIANPGTALIELGFITPRLASEIYAMASLAELDYVDMPLVAMGDKEQTIAFVGGDAAAKRNVDSLFPHLAYYICEEEGPGKGMLAAAMAYVGLAGCLMGTIEAMSLAKLSGLESNETMNVLARFGAGSRALVDYGPRIARFDFSGQIKVSEMLENLDTALCAAEDLGVTLPAAETAYQLYDLLSVVGGDEMSIQALALLYEDEQTCADYGLDWALAETVQQQQQRGPHGGFGDFGPDDDMDLPDDFPFGGGGPRPGHGHGHDGGGYPSAGSFFSNN